MKTSVAGKMGRFIGGAVGTILLSGAAQLGVSIAVGLSELSMNTIRMLIAKGSISADYLSKKAWDRETLAELIADIKVLVQEGKMKEKLADIVVEEIKKVHDMKIEIKNGKPDTEKNGKGFWELVQEKYQEKIGDVETTVKS